MMKKKIAKEVTIAKIGFAGVILSALILGIFGYLNSQKTSDKPIDKNLENKTKPINLPQDSPQATPISSNKKAESENNIPGREKQNTAKSGQTTNQVTVDKNNGQINVGTQNIHTQTNINKINDSTKKQ